MSDAITEVIAHSYNNGDGKIIVQTLFEHSNNVANLTKSIASSTGLSSVSFIIGLLHDIGKSKREFQDYLLCSNKTKTEHAVTSSLVAYDIISLSENNKYIQLLKELVHLVIRSHHTGLPDAGAISDNIKDINSDVKKYSYSNHYVEIIENNISHAHNELKEIVNSFSKFIKDNESELFGINNSKCKQSQLLAYFFGAVARYLLSCQIDADWYDTSLIFNNKKTDKNNEIYFDTIQDVFEKNIKKRFNSSILNSTNSLNRLRNLISNKAYDTARMPLGLFSLSVPTGAGKTLASFRFALEHAKVHGLNKIIYVIPFCSIIEQTACVLRDFLDHKFDQYILEDHSRGNISLDNTVIDEFTYKIITERWDCKIIITTAVQYLNIMYSNVNKNTRKLNKMASSVIIFDEIQSIPKKCRQLFNMSVDFLLSFMRSSVVICSATIPLNNSKIINYPLATNICDFSDIDTKNNPFVRTVLINKIGNNGNGKPRDCEYISSLSLFNAKKMGNCLVIVNSKKQARRIYNEIKRHLNNNGATSDDSVNIYCLSTDYCPKHRLDILNSVNDLLKSNKELILVSTQLIEAGVDIDFNSVIRVVAGADSIIQAAGRCNRNGQLRDIHGKKLRGPVYIVDFDNQRTELAYLDEIIKGIEISEEILLEDKFTNEIDLKEFLREFYEKYNFKYSDNNLYYIDDRGNTLDDYLSNNHSPRNTGFYKYFSHKFAETGKLFKTIDDNNKCSLFVDYSYSRDIFISFKNAIEHGDYAEVSKIRKNLSMYEIPVSEKLYKDIKVSIQVKDYKFIDYKAYMDFLDGVYDK